MNNNRIRFRRGTTEKLIESNDIIQYGQPVYDYQNNYLIIGDTSGKKISNLYPIKSRILEGYFEGKYQGANSYIIGPTLENGIDYLDIESDKSIRLRKNEITKLEIGSSETLSSNTFKSINIKTTNINDINGGQGLVISNNINVRKNVINEELTTLNKALTLLDTITLRESTATANILNPARFSSSVAITTTLTSGGQATLDSLIVTKKSEFNDEIKINSGKALVGVIGKSGSGTANRNQIYAENINATSGNIGTLTSGTVNINNGTITTLNSTGTITVANLVIG